jgi:hypothetical protein
MSPGARAVVCLIVCRFRRNVRTGDEGLLVTTKLPGRTGKHELPTYYGQRARAGWFAHHPRS